MPLIFFTTEVVIVIATVAFGLHLLIFIFHFTANLHLYTAHLGGCWILFASYTIRLDTLVLVSFNL